MVYPQLLADRKPAITGSVTLSLLLVVRIDAAELQADGERGVPAWHLTCAAYVRSARRPVGPAEDARRSAAGAGQAHSQRGSFLASCASRT
jgi:hypothetical protein